MTAIILAAGLSQRFGRDKLLARIKGKPMVLHVIELALKMKFDKTILVYRHEEVRKLAEGKNIVCRYNPNAAEGLSTSVLTGLIDTEDTDAYIFFLGDQPFIDLETVRELVEAYRESKGSIIVPCYEGRRGNPVIFASAWREQLERLSGDAGGRDIIKANLKEVCFVSIRNRKAGIDIDTWEEYLLHNPGY